MEFDPIQMQGIVRYANRLRIKDEDLAQHSYSVAYYCFNIADEFGIPDDVRNKAIAMSIIHDIGECFTSDLPHDVKTENPELKELCGKLEKKYVDRLPAIKSLWQEWEYGKEDNIPMLMVRLADVLSVDAYVKRELSLGNNTEIMKEILDNSGDRINVCHNQLLEEVSKQYGK